MTSPAGRLSSLLALCAFAANTHAQSFLSPIEGVAYQDWQIGNYVDLDPGSGSLDYRGGGYSYNNHSGIDYGVANFAAMDAGVLVYAAAAGTIVEVRDGLYDRNRAGGEYLTHPEGNPVPADAGGNLVVIDHGNGIMTRYAHLKKNSIRFPEDTIVGAGKVIGELASSGNSTGPHLHFELRVDGIPSEPFKAPDFWWQDPVDYAGDRPTSLDHGVTNFDPSEVQLQDRPVEHDVFLRSESVQRVGIWAQVSNIKSTDHIHFYVHRPDGSELLHEVQAVQFFSFDYLTIGFFLPAFANAQLGTWTYDVLLNDSLKLASDSFLVTKHAADFNDDGRVGSQDLARWRTSFGVDGAADADGDGDSDGYDFLVWQRQYGLGFPPPPNSAVPEPGAAVLFIAAGLAISLRRRKPR